MKVACNSNGSEKLPLFVIGKSIKPRCFKNVKTLSVEYTAKKKAWMMATTFTDWLLKSDKRFLREKLKVAIIIDNCLLTRNSFNTQKYFGPMVSC